MKRRLLFTLPPVLMMAALAACGYQLRGGGAADITDLRLQLPASEPELRRVLLRGLQSAGIRAHNADAAEARDYPLLAMGAERFSGRPASTTVQARAAQITLQLSVLVNLADGETALIEGETLSVERTFYQDLRYIAGNREEAELLRDEMRIDLVAQLMRRLEAAGR